MNNAGKGSVAPKIEPRSVPGRTREAPWCPRAFRERLGSTLGAPRGAPGVPRERPEGPQTTSAGGWLGFIDFIRFLLILIVKAGMIVKKLRPLSRSGVKTDRARESGRDKIEEKAIKTKDFLSNSFTFTIKID